MAAASQNDIADTMVIYMNIDDFSSSPSTTGTPIITTASAEDVIDSTNTSTNTNTNTNAITNDEVTPNSTNIIPLSCDNDITIATIMNMDNQASYFVISLIVNCSILLITMIGLCIKLESQQRY